MSVEPFTIKTSPVTLADLRLRLASTRLPKDDANDWRAGMNPSYLRDLLQYFRTQYDFRARESELNRLAHFKANIDGFNVHFVHERAKGERPLPLVLTHGFPDSFLRFAKLIPRLTDPAAYGADASDAFDVIVPSLPGYAFSDKPPKTGGAFELGNLWHRLMHDELGYRRFGAHGGDWGALVSEQLARSHSASVVGIHLTEVPFWHAFQRPKDPSPAELEFLEQNAHFQETKGAYALIQGTRPQTLAHGLNDSPAGLTAWIVEKFQAWSDCDGAPENCFTRDELLDNVMMYWLTESIASACLPYYDFTSAGPSRWILEKAKELVGSSTVPAGFAIFPKDLTRPPREWAARFFNVQRFTELPRGGHFAALEQPDLLAAEIREFFRPLR